MTLTPIGPNETEIEYPDGRTVLYSYSTPVAVFVPGRGALMTNKFHSSTTSKHLRRAIKRWGTTRTEVDPEEIEAQASR